MSILDRLKRKDAAESSGVVSILERSRRTPEAEGRDFYLSEIEMGGRQEAISSFLDDVSASLIQLQGLEAELRSKKHDLYTEFAERGRERAEFISLAKAYNQTREQLTQQLDHGNDIQLQLSAAQRELDKVRGELSHAEAEAQQREQEVSRLSTELRRTSNDLTEAKAKADRTNQRVAWLESENAAQSQQISDYEEKYKAQDLRIQELGKALALTEADCAAMRKHGDNQSDDINRLGRSLAEVEEALGRQQRKSQLLETQLAEEQSETQRVSQAADAVALSAKAHVEKADMRVETATARAARLESENSQLLQQLQEAKAADRATQRDLVDVRATAERQDERIRLLEADLARVHAETQATDNARLVAVERGDQLMGMLDKRNAEVELFAGRTAELQRQLGEIEAEIAAERAKTAEELRQMKDANQKLRGEYAIVQGSLEAARQDRARLADQLHKQALQPTLQTDLPPESLDLFGNEIPETAPNIRAVS